MTNTPRKFVAGNWKMHGSSASLDEALQLSQALQVQPANCRVALFPPAPLIHRMSEVLQGGPVEVGAQDCRGEAHGPFTGDASPEMLHDAGARLVILGHSERRFHHRESDGEVAAKAEGALRGGLEPIICVGEDIEHHRAGEAGTVVRAQIEASLPASLYDHPFSIAYEPRWAIGSGLTPEPSELVEMHGLIRDVLSGLFTAGRNVRILYGGSVTPLNAIELLEVEGVDGALVGGASLKAADFLAIIRAA